MAFSIGNFIKDPDETLDYTVDYSAFLPATDEITSAAWNAGTLSVTSQSFSDKTATVWLSGGVEGTKYTVTSRIVTSEGRIVERSFIIKVKSR